MSFNKAKVLKSAEKYVQQGKIPAAIDEYRKIVEADPNDLTMINTLGDLCVRAGRTEEAIQNFSRIAENYRENGFTLKAIAMYKKISKLEPSNFETSLKLADLYSKQGLIVDARQQYLIVAEAYKRNGQSKRALEVLQKIADLDPENTAVRIKLAENYQAEGLTDQAHDAYVYAGQEAAKKNRIPEAISAFTKALSINSGSRAALKALADAYTQQGDVRKALDILAQAQANNPNDIDVMVLLGRTYISAKMLEEAENTFSKLIEVDKSRYDYLVQLGRAYIEVGKFDRAIGTIDRCMDLLIARRQEEKAVSLLKSILEYDASNMQALKRLADVYARIREDHNLSSTLNILVDVALRKQQKADAIQALKQLIEIEPDEPSYKQRLASLGGGSVEVQPKTPPTPSYSIPTAFEPAVAATTPLSVNKANQLDNQSVERQLREAEMFASRGYGDSAAQILEDLITQHPRHIEARLKLKQIYLDGGMEDKAATQCLELAKLYEAQGDKASASDLLSEAYDLNPALNKGASSPGRGANGQPVKKLADSIEIDLSASLDSDFGAEPAKPQSTTYQPQASSPSGFDLFNSKPSSAPPASNLPPTSSLSYGLPDLFGQPSAQASAGPSKAAPPLSGFDLFNQGQSSSQSTPQPPQTPAGQFGLPNFFGQTVPDQPAFQPAKPSTQAPSSLGDIFNASSQSPLANVPSVPIGAKGETTGVPSTSFEIDVDDTSTSSQIAKDKILKDELDGVDFYIAQGYMEIARGALEDLEKQHPNHPAILQRFAQMGITKPSTNMLKTSSDMEAVEELPDSAILESSPASVPAPTTPFNPFGGFPSPGKALQSPPLATPQKQTPPPQPPAPAPMPDVLASRVQPTAASQASGGSLFDSLISDVEAELDEMPTHDMMPMAKTVASSPATSSSKPVSSLSDQSDLGSIFTEFQQEFETSDKPDFETHYNLGLAYKDMELFDDAIEQFQLAFKATSPTSGDGNYFNCCNMLGFCFLKNNMARPSAVWYKRGLEAPNRSDEEYQAMRFDLAGAHEQLKEYKKALECLQEVYALDINYRDVGSKIREIEEKLNQEG